MVSFDVFLNFANVFNQQGKEHGDYSSGYYACIMNPVPALNSSLMPVPEAVGAL